MALFWRRHPVPEDDLSAYVDGELDDARRTRVEAHVDGCGSCREAVEELRSVRSALSALPRADAPRSFALREADVTPSPAAPMSLGRAPQLLGGLAMVAFVAFFVLVGVDLSDGSSTSREPGVSTTIGEADLNEFDNGAQLEGLSSPKDDGTARGGDGEEASADGDAAQPMTSGSEPLAPAEEAERDSAEPRAQERLSEVGDDDTNLRAAQAAAVAVGIVALGSLALVWWRRRVAG